MPFANMSTISLVAAEEIVVTNKINTLVPLLKKCFVCGEHIKEKFVHLVTGRTSYTNASFPTKIGELVGNGCMVIAFMEDVLCGKCVDLLNLLDKLETDLKVVRKTLTSYLASKYNVDHKDLYAKFDQSSVREERATAKLIETVKIPPKLFCCELCTFTTRDRSEVNVHTEECLKLPHACSACPKRFATPQILAQHNARVHKRTWSCRFCSSLFVSQQEVRNHTKSHPKCTVCNTMFANQDEVEEHTRIKHPEKATFEALSEELNNDSSSNASEDCGELEFYTCSVCGLTFIKANQYNEHIKMHDVVKQVRRRTKKNLSTKVSRVEDGRGSGKKNNGDSAKTEKTVRCRTDKYTPTLTDPLSLNTQNKTPRNSVSNSKIFGNENIQFKEGSDSNSNMSGTIVRRRNSIKCCICLKTILSSDLLKSHVMDHLRNGCCECRVCNENLSGIAPVLEHCERHSQNHKTRVILKASIQCRYCSSSFTSKEACISHENTHADVLVYACSNCDARCRTNQEVMEHLSRRQCGRCCQYCGMTTENLTALRQHERLHLREPSPPEKHPSEPFECEHCQQLFKTSEDFLDHAAVHHKEQYEQKRFHEEQNQSFECEDCQQVFQTSKHLRNHTFSVHGENPRSHATDDSVQRKRERHKQRSYECKECRRVFKREAGLLNHSAVHTGQYKYRCDVCEKGFVYSMIFEQHLRTHTKEERHVCEICGRRFPFLSSYYLHRRSHENARSHKCNICGRIFRTSSLLHIHKRKHTGEKPYKCPDCPMSFAVNGSLTRHSVVHTGVYPYKCKDCDRKFSTGYRFKKHRAEEHGDNETTKYRRVPKTDSKTTVPGEEAGEETEGSQMTGKDVVLDQVLGENN